MLSVFSWIFLGQLPSVMGKKPGIFECFIALSPVEVVGIWVTPLLNSRCLSGCVPSVLAGIGAPLFAWRP